MAWQAWDTSMITDRRQAHDHQGPCLYRVTTHRLIPIAGALSRFDWLAAQTVGAQYGEPSHLCNTLRLSQTDGSRSGRHGAAQSG
jgi:hypothetical protein